AGEPVDYLRDVNPLLARHGTGGQGREKQKSGRRLDTAANIRKGADSGPVVQPGASDSSILVIAAGGGSDSIPAMPPKGEGDRLTRDQVTLIAKWIDAGAKAPSGEGAAGPKRRSAHSAFQPWPPPPL